MRMSRTRRALAACAIAAGLLGNSAAFTQQVSAKLLEPDAVDPALTVACAVSFDAERGVTTGLPNFRQSSIHGVAVVTWCPGVPVLPIGTVTLTIVKARSLWPATCTPNVPPTTYPVVAGVGAGEITAVCPSDSGGTETCPSPLSQAGMYRVKAVVSWPGKGTNTVAYSNCV